MDTVVQILLNSGPLGAIVLAFGWQFNNKLETIKQAINELKDQEKINEKRLDKLERKVSSVEQALSHIDPNYIPLNGGQ